VELVMARVEHIGDAVLHLGDCRDILPTLGPVDAVVTDPPYGIGETNKAVEGRQWQAHWNTKQVADQRDFGQFEWDQKPVDSELLEAVRKAGQWQIIFGGNYYPAPATSCWLVWDKLNGANDFADCELAWTNLPKAVRRIRYLWNGMLRANGEGRGDHPTQKPEGVMRWALQQLPANAQTILDPFMGSGTTGVAAVSLGLQFTGIEREVRYFDAACRRIEAETKRPRLFTEATTQPVQPSLLGDAA
jgi:DNA modification methylase